MQILLKHRIITHIRKDSTEKRLFIWPLESAQTFKVKMDSVFLSLGCCNRISLNDWLENDRNLLCIIVKAGKSKARAQQIQYLVRLASWFIAFLLCRHIIHGIKKLSGGSFVTALILSMGASPSWLGHFPRTLPSNTIPLSSVQLLSYVWLFAVPWTTAHQASLLITNSQSLIKLMSVELVMPSNCFTLCCHLLLLPPIFPSIRVFSSESVLCIRWPEYWSFSFNMSPSMNIQDWFPLGLTGLIFQSKGLSRVFSNTAVQKHQFFGTQRSLLSNSHIHTWLLEKP